MTSETPTAESVGRPLPDWAEPVTSRPRLVVFALVGVFALLGWRVGLSPDLPAFLYLGAIGVALAVIDIALHRLPDPLTLSAYPIGAALIGAAAPFTADGSARFVHALYGAGALFLVFAIQWVIVPNALGLGDVKLAGPLGLYLGWLGMPAWMLGVLAMFFLGGFYAIAMLVTRRAKRGSVMPFGPFMLVGTLAAILVHAGT